MRQLEKMGLHSHILPALEGLGENHAEQFYYAKSATIYDCRRLSSEFLVDTGAMALEESCALRTIARLPAPIVYLEFDGEIAVLAHEVDNYLEGEGCDPKITIEFKVYQGWGLLEQGEIDKYMITSDDAESGIISNGIDWMTGDVEDDSWPMYSSVNCDHAVSELAIEAGAQHLLGVIWLLRDKLLAAKHEFDPAPKLNKARVKKKRLPISADRYVLELNLGAVRQAVARSSPLRSHESPRLHWRRGHSRVLHRGSEFEKMVWVSRCLVGDPDRGYANKSYRLRHETPMLVAA